MGPILGRRGITSLVRTGQTRTNLDPLFTPPGIRSTAISRSAPGHKMRVERTHVVLERVEGFVEVGNLFEVDR